MTEERQLGDLEIGNFRAVPAFNGIRSEQELVLSAAVDGQTRNLRLTVAKNDEVKLRDFMQLAGRPFVLRAG